LTISFEENQTIVSLAEEDHHEAFEEETDNEPSGSNPILDDILRHIGHPRSPGNRYTEATRRWVFELLRTCGRKTLKIRSDHIPLPSRQRLTESSHPPL
jgi:hypothetical protein